MAEPVTLNVALAEVEAKILAMTDVLREENIDIDDDGIMECVNSFLWDSLSEETQVVLRGRCNTSDGAEAIRRVLVDNVSRGGQA